MNYNTKYVVRLTSTEREELEGVVRRGKVAAPWLRIWPVITSRV